MKKICITAIDTDAGKTVVTGLLARYLQQQGKQVITQKVAQTGCNEHDVAPDIVEHRRVMGVPLTQEDKDGLTCPYRFQYPCSPHLAAEHEKRLIDVDRLTRATSKLLQTFDTVILEGVGGFLVPLTRDLTLLDYLVQEKYPLILVTHPHLGSINHTLAALECISNRGLTLLGIVYNRYGEKDKIIGDDSRTVFQDGLRKCGFPETIVDCYDADRYTKSDAMVDFSPLFA